jgi:regulator of replication initiation timing
LETIIVEILSGINPLLGALAALTTVIIAYLARENKAIKKENTELRNQYTSDLKENIESMVEINHTIRTFIERDSTKSIADKIDSLVNLVNLINHTLTSLEHRLNSLPREK